MDELDALGRDGVIGVYFVPATVERENGAIVVEFIGGPKRYAWYWLHLRSWVLEEDGKPPLMPDWKWRLPDDAVVLWEESPTSLD